jgi:hypothetical protein
MDIEGIEIPQSVGRRADLYAEVRQMRLDMEKEVERVKAVETKIKESIIADLSQSPDTGAAGLKYRAQLVKKEKPKLADWGVFTSWIRKNDRFDMIEHRIAQRAVMDYYEEEGRLPPGTEIIVLPDVSITKV